MATPAEGGPDQDGGIAVTTTDDAAPALAGPRRWSLVWSQRPRLLKIARNRTGSEQDAEDVVAEALVRAMESPEIGEERLPAWLTTVTVRLCVDLQRERAREQRLWSRAGAPAATGSCEERVCERSEAAWVARRLTGLPSRQAQALRLRADGHDVDEVARSLGVSYRTAESLLARGRATARGWLVSGVAVLAALIARWGKIVRFSWAGKAAMISAGVATLGVAVATQTAHPHTGMVPRQPTARPDPRPAAPAIHRAAPHRSAAARASHPASPAHSTSATATPTAPGAGSSSVTVNPALPQNVIPQPRVQVPVPTLQVPQPQPLPTGGLGGLKLPSVSVP